jgi:hypothetical protein
MSMWGGSSDAVSNEAPMGEGQSFSVIGGFDGSPVQTEFRFLSDSGDGTEFRSDGGVDCPQRKANGARDLHIRCTYGWMSEQLAAS